MISDSKKASWLKWSVGAVIALIGAAGGAVALLEYLDAKRAAAETRYQQAIATWDAFTPAVIGQNKQTEMLLGWYIDLDVGLVAMSLTGSDWDLKSDLELIYREEAGKQRAVGTKWEGLRANTNVQWAHLGVTEFSLVGYRDVRDATFQTGGWLYRSHPTAAPGPGYIFAIKTSDNNVAKVQIVRYEPHNSYSRRMFVRYEVYPIVADPPRPRRP
ncbi:hypothetical protein [Rheinheimera pleomorphica]|uniref:hypothetical protein n=1 Tax=Rheinheimera pleomorphica TaxID=2703963 RepID=UPI001422AF71|nr:hypothetical protein [Rheinheimera pleomorphica]